MAVTTFWQAKVIVGANGVNGTATVTLDYDDAAQTIGLTTVGQKLTVTLSLDDNTGETPVMLCANIKPTVGPSAVRHIVAGPGAIPPNALGRVTTGTVAPAVVVTPSPVDTTPSVNITCLIG